MITKERSFTTINMNLLEAGEPFPIAFQIGYGSSYLVSTTSPLGSGYKNVKITFSGSAGAFSPPEPLFLTPQHTTESNVTLTSGMQKIVISKIQLLPPTPDNNGDVFLTCTYTDINGEHEQSFNGYISEWKSTGPISS